MDKSEEYQNYLQEKYVEQVAHPNPIAYFLALTSKENPQLESIMGSLSSKIMPEQF